MTLTPCNCTGQRALRKWFRLMRPYGWCPDAIALVPSPEKEETKAFSSPSENTVRRQEEHFQEEAKHGDTLVLGFSASRTMKNKFPLFKHPSLWYFFMEPEKTKTLLVFC